MIQNRQRARRWLVAAACALSSSCSGGAHGGTRQTNVALAAQSLETESAQRAAEPRPHERFSHEDVLAILRHDDSVLPELPPVHPVHTVYNREAVIPPMCYTRTEGQHNPCYVCHQDEIPERPNHMDDGALQQAYSFSDVGTKNHWRNLFEDRSERVAQISDAEILEWIGQDNYSELAPRLREAGFRGYIPDLTNLQLSADAFDAEGFAKDGSHWVAFNYKPMPSTFWPTNGSTDDVMIRLPAPFRTSAEGEYSRDVYKANLALVEANIKALPRISVPALDEQAVGVDLNGDGELGTITEITATGTYVGAARRHLKLPHLYPQDTEFLHSVRYVGVDDGGDVYVPRRMKELRYMRKRWTMTEPQLYEAYMQEHDAKDVGQLPGFPNRGQFGLDNEMGWVVTGFIENRSGRLRVNTYEENFTCMGCHTSIGSTIDSTFSFPRKVDGAAGWGYVNLRGMPDAPTLGESRGEIATYLERAGGGGEFRSNPEMAARFFDGDRPSDEKLAAARDVHDLIAPSRERALTLNKAYRVIVDDQDFVYGRDATVVPPKNVYDEIDNGQAPTLPPDRTYRWDIRLDWSAVR
ncbi:MAG: hypothetical protein PVI30_18690 [Myxococcales bacterium]